MSHRRPTSLQSYTCCIITYHHILWDGVEHSANVLRRHEVVQVLSQRLELLVALLFRFFGQHLQTNTPTSSDVSISKQHAMSSPYLGLFHEVALHALQYQSAFLFDHAAVLFSTSMVLLILPAVVSAETALQLKNHVMKKRHVFPVLPRASSPPKLFPSSVSAKASLDFVDRIAMEQSSRQVNVS